MKKYLICGKGVVGEAWGNALKGWGNQVEYYDPYKGKGVSTVEGKEYDGAFVCVPTPTLGRSFRSNEVKDQYKQDLSAVLDSLGLCEDRVDVPWVSIRSTLDPRRVKELVDFYNGSPLIAHPEFLSERHAEREARNPRVIVVGSNDFLYLDRDFNNGEGIDYIGDIFPSDLNVEYWEVSTEEAFFIKYAANIMFSMKVIYAETMKDMYEDLFPEPFDIGDSHAVLNWLDKLFAGRNMDPTMGEKRGFGGKCLPKDTKLWYNCGYDLIDTIVDINNRLR